MILTPELFHKIKTCKEINRKQLNQQDITPDEEMILNQLRGLDLTQILIEAIEKLVGENRKLNKLTVDQTFQISQKNAQIERLLTERMKMFGR